MTQNNDDKQPQPPAKPTGPEPRYIHENFTVVPDKTEQDNEH